MQTHLVSLDGIGPLHVTFENERDLTLFQGLPAQGLAVVGTRTPERRSRALMERAFEGLAGEPLVVISGIARGIDAWAHELALECGLPTIAVLGGGFEKFYPKENRALAERILGNGGLVVSEHPPEASPEPNRFKVRNRVIASLARAVWVVEAPFDSGALNTAWWARGLERDVYVTPSLPDDNRRSGNQKLLDSFQAEACWGFHSFGKTWLTLATKRPGQPSLRLARAAPMEELTPLAQECFSLLKSMVEDPEFDAAWFDRDRLIERLLAVSPNFTPGKIFLAFEELSSARRIRFTQGKILELEKGD